jgi:hypothetical protein
MNIPMMIPKAVTNDLTSKEGFVRRSELNIASSSDFIHRSPIVRGTTSADKRLARSGTVNVSPTKGRSGFV